MKRLLVLGTVTVAILGLVRAGRGSVPKLIDRMLERFMPKMMDACFAEMGMERRRFMLSHCRGMLDRMEQKYVKAKAA